MLVLLVTLAAQVPAPCPRAAARETDAGWAAYRREAVAEAGARFAAADSLCPGDHAVQLGLGFVRLREGEARAALERFAAIRATVRRVRLKDRRITSAICAY